MPEWPTRDAESIRVLWVVRRNWCDFDDEGVSDNMESNDGQP